MFYSYRKQNDEQHLLCMTAFVRSKLGDKRLGEAAQRGYMLELVQVSIRP